MIEMPMIAKGTEELDLLPGMSNRHGLVAGATGTGKTVTLQVMAEAFSSIGVLVFAADVKGDLSGISQPGKSSQKLDERVKSMGLGEWTFAGCPVVFWDVFGKEGHPVRATISEMGPLLISRILNLNDTQTGVLTLVFKAVKVPEGADETLSHQYTADPAEAPAPEPAGVGAAASD